MHGETVRNALENEVMSQQFLEYVFGLIQRESCERGDRPRSELHPRMESDTAEDQLLLGVQGVVRDREDLRQRPVHIAQLGKTATAAGQLTQEVGRRPRGAGE